MLLSDVCLTSVCLSRTSGLTREMDMPMKTKIGTEVAHVTRESDTTFKIKSRPIAQNNKGKRQPNLKP